VQSDFYWSSTTVAGFPGFAWRVGLDFGLTDAFGKDGTVLVWPVRGGA
jgi:hypothetical protein